MGHALNITFIVMLVVSALLAVFSRDLLADLAELGCASILERD